MKHKLILFFAVLAPLFAQACGPSPAQLTATAALAAVQTQTAAPTNTRVPTATSTVTPLSTPTYAPECKLLSVTPVANSAYPTFEFEVGDFLGGETLSVRLLGVKLVGDGFEFDLPFENEVVADDQGHADGTIAVTLIVSNIGKPQIPSEFTLEITGLLSGCKLTQIVAWPN